MHCMRMLGEAFHYQISSRPTLVSILDTIKESRNSSTLYNDKQTERGSAKTSNVLYTSGNLGLESPIGVITTPTIENRGISSLVKHQGKSSLTGMTDSGSYGSMSSGEPQYHSHCFSDLWINGTTVWRRKGELFLSLDLGRSLYQLRLIQVTGGGRVLNIWRTPDNSGEDSLESITYQKLPASTAIPLSSITQKPSITESPTSTTSLPGWSANNARVQEETEQRRAEAMELTRELQGKKNKNRASEPDRVIGQDGPTTSGSQFDPDGNDYIGLNDVDQRLG